MPRILRPGRTRISVSDFMSWSISELRGQTVFDFRFQIIDFGILATEQSRNTVRRVNNSQSAIYNRQSAISPRLGLCSGLLQNLRGHFLHNDAKLEQGGLGTAPPSCDFPMRAH